MTACNGCIRASLLANSAIGFAEDGLIAPADAKRLLQYSTDDQIDVLRAGDSHAAEQLESQIDGFRGELAQSLGLWMICRHNGDFPNGFHPLSDSPSVLYGIGDRSLISALDSRPAVALVGARRASSYGRDVAFRLGSDLAAAGLTIVSGMALGIDGAAHRGALQGSGRTIAVLAGGPDRPYPPSHRLLYNDIAERGAVVSERPPGSRAKRWGFPARNRLIAGLSQLTVLVEGNERSGAKHTVEFANQIGQRPGAVPGPVTSPLSDAPNSLLFDGCHLIRDARDVLDIVCGVGVGQLFDDRDDSDREETNVDDPTDPASRTHEAIKCGASTAQQIARDLPDLETRQIVQILGELELRGMIVRDAAGRYRSEITAMLPRTRV